MSGLHTRLTAWGQLGRGKALRGLRTSMYTQARHDTARTKSKDIQHIVSSLHLSRSPCLPGTVYLSTRTLSTQPAAQIPGHGSYKSGIPLLVLDDREGVLGKSSGVQSMYKQANVTIFDGINSVPTSDTYSDAAASARVLFTLRERTTIDEQFLSHFPSLELILQSGGHAYHIDTGAVNTRGIAVALGRKVTAPLRSVPELAFALAINTLRDIPRLHTSLQQGASGNGEPWPAGMGRCLGGKRLGILGLGRHGQRIAKIAEAFDMEVVAWDRSLDAATVSGGDGRVSQVKDSVGALSHTPDSPLTPQQLAAIPRLSLTDLLSTSDVVSIHLRLSPESTHLLDASRLAMMKEGSIVVNTSRGRIIEEDALISALRDPEHPLSAAGLDVYTCEPLDINSELRSLPNVTLTPHIGWTVEEVLQDFANIASSQLQLYLQGQLPPTDLLNPDVVTMNRVRWAGAGFTPS